MKPKTSNKPTMLLEMPLEGLFEMANEVRRVHLGNRLELCSIFNAKSGHCSEDCKFCAQSSRHHTQIDVYPMKSKKEIVTAAKKAKSIGAERFGIVTSGNRLSKSEVGMLAEAIREICKNTGLGVCGSLGALEKEQLVRLKLAGLQRFHHNIETSRNFYPQIVSTHDFDQRIATIQSAKDVGLEVCSGGIIGMGESWQDRIDMAKTLKQLNVDSVPLNILIPVEGTAIENAAVISREDILRTVCIFRIILKDKTIKIAAGRETSLRDSQHKAFLAGANGMIIGGYLTVKGDTLESDRTLIKRIMDEWT